MKGYLMQMQPFSVNDGDGIRTTIFLAGCPLHCKWCANPEGLRQHPVVGFYARLCIGCGACAAVCPKGIGIDLNAERENASAAAHVWRLVPRGQEKHLFLWRMRMKSLRKRQSISFFTAIPAVALPFPVAKQRRSLSFWSIFPPVCMIWASVWISNPAVI